MNFPQRPTDPALGIVPLLRAWTFAPVTQDDYFRRALWLVGWWLAGDDPPLPPDPPPPEDADKPKPPDPPPPVPAWPYLRQLLVALRNEDAAVHFEGWSLVIAAVTP